MYTFNKWHIPMAIVSLTCCATVAKKQATAIMQEIETKREARSLEMNELQGRAKSPLITFDVPESIDAAQAAITERFKRVEKGTTVLAVAHGNRAKPGHNPELEFILVTADGETDKDFSVSYNRRNGVNTDFFVTHPEGYVVLALRRTVPMEDGSEREVTYTPYTKMIDEPAVRRRGMQYLESVVKQAQEKAKVIRSRSNPEQTVDQTIPAKVAETMALIEHMDPNRVKRGETQDAINEIFTVLGANQANAYNYSVSTKGARGLFQFMPATYKSIAEQNPDAALIPGFADGMRNHVNGALASLLLFDADLKLLKVEDREAIQKNPSELGQYLAKAYNGGGKCAALKRCPGNSPTPPQETLDYVDKFIAVHGLLFPNLIAKQ